ncbi:unnamed protein product, partial [Brenthis ino]
MKFFVFTTLVLCLLNVVRADDDGSYHPELNGDRGNVYNRVNPARYNYRHNNYLNRNNLNYPNYGYQPLYQQLAPPFAAFKDNRFISSTTARPVIAVSTALPPKYAYAKNYGNEGYARIIEQDNDLIGNNYKYSYRTENGISAGESGNVDASNSAGGTRVSGFYEYIGADGLTYRVDYTADENGFHPSGAHLP